MPPKVKTRALSSVMQTEAPKSQTGVQNNVSKNLGWASSQVQRNPSKIQVSKNLNLFSITQDKLPPTIPLGGQGNVYHVQMQPPKGQVQDAPPSIHADVENNASPANLILSDSDFPIKRRRRTQRQRIAMEAITRANKVLESSPADPNREDERQVHISSEVLEAYYEEINESNSTHAQASNASISTVRKNRGPTQATSVIPPKGERWKCLIIDRQAVGQAASKLAIVLGLYARMEGYFPPHKEWNEGCLPSFNDVMKDIMRDYDFVDHEGMPANMADVTYFCKVSLQKKIRDWRCWLKHHYYVDGIPDDMLMKAPDIRITQANWELLVKFWESDKKVLEAKRNRKNRGEDRATHTLGSKSIASHNQDLREKLGNNYTTLSAYIKAHQTKSGEYPDEYTRNMCEKVIATCVERNLTSNSEPSVLSPILDVVYKGHHGGYERGRGLGWSRAIPWSNMAIHASHENVKQLTIELEKAKTEIEAVHAREREMEARRLEEKGQMQARLERMEAMLSMHFHNGSVADFRVDNGLPLSQPPQ